MKLRKNKFGLVLLATSLIFIDQLVKYLVRHFDGFYICNYGIAFGIEFAGVIFWLLVGVFLLSFLYLLINRVKFLNLVDIKYGVILIFSGAISNLVDRICMGCVIDFIDIKIFNYPLFNLADSFIFIGAILIFYKLYRPSVR